MWGRNQINIPEPVQKCVCTQRILSSLRQTCILRAVMTYYIQITWYLWENARRDERESRESRPGNETIGENGVSGPLG